MALMENMEGVMPTGDAPPEVQDGNAIPEKVYAGKYKSPEELENAYKEAESRIGKQGSEVGELRKTNEALAAQLNAMKMEIAKSQQKPEPTTDYEQKLADIVSSMEAGDLTIEQAIMESNKITAQKASQEAIKQSQSYFQEQLKKQKAETVQSEFIKNNPDFLELQKSGALEAIKQENPMHDDFSALFEYRARQAQEKLKTGIDQTKAEAEASTKVLKKPGAAIRDTKPKPLKSEAEMKSAMLARLKEG